MIKIDTVEITGWEAAIRGMRNPLESWEKSDSDICYKMPDYHRCENCDFDDDFYCIGDNDLRLMLQLSNAGSDHAKYRRMITVYADINAPLYWWKEFDTYKVGTVANSCSTMHKIHKKEFTVDDFSMEHLEDFDAPIRNDENNLSRFPWFKISLESTIDVLNYARELYLETKDKKFWWQMIQLLPSSYNQKRTVMLNYEVLANIYKSRKNHKLDEWKDFCKWIGSLPYSELICGPEFLRKEVQNETYRC